MRKLTEKEASLLNRIQSDLPVSENIFHHASECCGMSLKETIDIIRNLKEEGLIRSISGTFNSRKLGYHSLLCAMKVENADSAAAVIAEHSGVSYVYLHDCEYQIWFRVAVRAEVKCEDEIKKISEKVNAQDYIIFRKEMKLRLKTVLPAIAHKECDRKIPVIESLDSCRTHDSITIKEELRDFIRKESEKEPIVGDIYNEFENGLNMKTVSEEDIRLIKILQNDLPLTERPFTNLLQELGEDIDVLDFCIRCEELKKFNILRKYGARIRHDYTGYAYNAMTVWNLNDKDINHVKEVFAKVKNVKEISVMISDNSNWKYNLFAVIHAKTEKQFFEMLDFISEETGISDCKIFKTLKEYKRDKIKYFTNEEL